MNSLPPKSVSDDLLNSIQKALQEEKVPVWKRALKIGIWTLVFSALSLIPFIQIVDFSNKLWPMIACVFWIALLGLGFAMYFKPQPRLAVPGYWSHWIYAKVIIGATIGTLLAFLICPSFAFVSTDLSWNPLNQLTHQLMSVGGMTLCMLFCGFLFSVIISLVAFSSITRVLTKTRVTKLLLLCGITLVAQFPIIFFQFLQPALRPTVSYWILGAALGTFLTSVLIRILAPLFKKKLSQ